MQRDILKNTRGKSNQNDIPKNVQVTHRQAGKKKSKKP